MDRIIQITYGAFIYALEDLFSEIYKDSKIIISDNLDINPDILILSGGSDINPKIYGELNRNSYGINDERDRAEISLLNRYYTKIPIIGICRGHQLIGAYLYKCKLYQDINPPHNSKHEIFSIKDKPPILVNSIHHQGINFRLAPEEYRHNVKFIYKNVVEEFMDKNNKVYSVQYHPEVMDKRDNFVLNVLNLNS